MHQGCDWRAGSTPLRSLGKGRCKACHRGKVKADRASSRHVQGLSCLAGLARPISSLSSGEVTIAVRGKCSLPSKIPRAGKGASDAERPLQQGEITFRTSRAGCPLRDDLFTSPGSGERAIQHREPKLAPRLPAARRGRSARHPANAAPSHGSMGLISGRRSRPI